jgi:hypothetical protein
VDRGWVHIEVVVWFGVGEVRKRRLVGNYVYCKGSGSAAFKILWLLRNGEEVSYDMMRIWKANSMA